MTLSIYSYAHLRNSFHCSDELRADFEDESAVLSGYILDATGYLPKGGSIGVLDKWPSRDVILVCSHISRGDYRPSEGGH